MRALGAFVGGHLPPARRVGAVGGLDSDSGFTPSWSDISAASASTLYFGCHKAR